MAAVMTYDSLVDDIKLYLERVDEQTVGRTRAAGEVIGGGDGLGAEAAGSGAHGAFF